MEETIINPMDDPALSPADYAALMPECTDENGMLRRKELIETFEALYGEIGKISESSVSAEYELRDDPRTGAAGEEAAKYLADGILDDAVVFPARRVCALFWRCYFDIADEKSGKKEHSNKQGWCINRKRLYGIMN